MIRATSFFLLVALPACAGTQSGTAFTLRSAAPEEPVTVMPSKAGQHDRALSDCIERSLEQQEAQDRTDPALAEHPSVPTPPVARDEGLGGAPVTAAR